MKKTQHLFFLFIVFGFITVKAQNIKPDYSTLISNFQNATKARNFKDMKVNSESLIKYYPDDYAGYALNGYFLLCRGQNNMAEKQFNTMLQFNPTDAASYSLMAIYKFLMKKPSEAKKYLQWAFQMSNYNEFKDELLNDANVIKEMANRTDLENYKLMINEVANENLQDMQTANDYINCTSTLYQGKPCDQINTSIAKLNLKKPYNPFIELIGLYSKSIKNYIVYENDKAKTGFDNFLSKSKPYKNALSFFRAYAFFNKASINYYNYNYKSALINVNKALQEIKNVETTTSAEAYFLSNKIMYQGALKLEQESLQTSYNLLAIAEKLNDDLYKAKANNNIGQYYINSVIPAERTQAATHIYTALQEAKKGGDKNLENTIRGNYVITLWQQGKHEEAKLNSDKLFNDYMAVKNYNNAEVTANNLGFMYYFENNFSMAAKYFQKSVNMTEEVKGSLSSKQRLELMNERSSSYTGLVMSYQKLGNTKALFNVQDNNRSRFLRDRLKPNAQAATLEDAQSLLGSNDLLLYYTLTAPGEIVINAITQNSAQVFYNYPIDDWIKIKKQWTDRSKKIQPSFNSFMQNYSNDIVNGNFITYASKEQSFTSENFKIQVQWTRELLENDEPEFDVARNTFLKQWYNFTLKPVEDLLSTKSNIIISASNELNYLPFEAFIDTNNHYFIESHNVKYIPSVSVWKILKSRQYGSNKNPAIVMGGAIYQPSGNVKGYARGIDDFYAISESINEKISTGNFNFKSELQTMGFGGANYLKGTLQEVEFVGKLNPNVKVVTGLNMKESYLKQLSKSGQLKNYKILMLSTHGFTVDIIPELSGIMMSQPNGGDGNEDTFLLAPEIARLNLEADLAILSACDTGLGALVGGEGINGLNSSFLVAGANQTMLSLWPVNDFSTSLTMQNLFKMIIVDGKDAFTALNTIKRAIAKGEAGDQYKAPKYWAPFLLNGK